MINYLIKNLYDSKELDITLVSNITSKDNEHTLYNKRNL